MTKDTVWLRLRQHMAVLAITITAAVGLTVATGAPAHAATGPCGRQLVEVYRGAEHWDNGSFVNESNEGYILPATLSGCSNIWLGQFDKCGYVRVVRISPLPYWYEAWQYTGNTGCVPSNSGYTQHAGFPSGALQAGYGIVIQFCEVNCPNSSTSQGFNTGWMYD